MSWVFHLRKDVKFHNGEPFNAQTVKFSFERAASEKSTNKDKRTFASMESVRAVEEHVVVIVNKELDPDFLFLMGQATAVIVEVVASSALHHAEVKVEEGLQHLRDEVGDNIGVYDNPTDLTENSWTVMRFSEIEEAGKLEWLIRKDGCMHCADPGCLKACPAPGAIVQYSNGIVDFIEENCIGCGYCVKGCPFNIPRISKADHRSYKCTLCSDRVAVGQGPACAKACPTQAIVFARTKIRWAPFPAACSKVARKRCSLSSRSFSRRDCSMASTIRPENTEVVSNRPVAWLMMKPMPRLADMNSPITVPTSA